MLQYLRTDLNASCGLSGSLLEDKLRLTGGAVTSGAGPIAPLVVSGAAKVDLVWL